MNFLKLAVGTTAALALVGVLAAATAPSEGSAAPATRTAQVKRVVDGDTFVIAGGERIRVRNFDTPELRQYDCPEEKIAAQGARRAARALLARKTVRLSVSGRDRYGRTVADVSLLGPRGSKDFVDVMVASGHGARWRYGEEPQPTWCPKRPSWTSRLFRGDARASHL